MRDFDMTRDEWQTFNHDAKYFKRINENRFYCPNCGHTIIMMPTTKKKMCTWCRNWVFRDSKDEFKYRLKEQMKKC